MSVRNTKKDLLEMLKTSQLLVAALQQQIAAKDAQISEQQQLIEDLSLENEFLEGKITELQATSSQQEPEEQQQPALPTFDFTINTTSPTTTTTQTQRRVREDDSDVIILDAPPRTRSRTTTTTTTTSTTRSIDYDASPNDSPVYHYVVPVVQSHTHSSGRTSRKIIGFTDPNLSNEPMMCSICQETVPRHKTLGCPKCSQACCDTCAANNAFVARRKYAHSLCPFCRFCFSNN